MNHDQCFRNRSALAAATLCACFNCLKIFSPDLIRGWTDDDETALCPFCEMDTVLPAPDGVLNINEVMELHLKWMVAPAPKMRMVEYGQAKIEVVDETPLDRWLLARLEQTRRELDENIEDRPVLSKADCECLALMSPSKREAEQRRRLAEIKSCPGCGNKVADKFVVLNAGALLKTGDSGASLSDDLCGFFSIGWHDHERIGRPHVDIAESATPGQIDLYFHGTACLRAWFERVARRLEQ